MSSYYSSYKQQNGSRRAIVFVIIVAVHVFFAWAFINGTLQRAVKLVTAPLDTTLIEEEKPKEEPPPPPPVVVQERPPVQVVTPDINISIPVDTPPPPIQNVTTQPVAPVAAPVRAPVVVGTGLVTTYAPNSEDYYPAAARREEREGRPVVHVCVGANGKITGADIKQSSGSDDLDEGGVKLVRAMRFKAATQEGKPIDACKDVAVKFEMKKK